VYRLYCSIASSLCESVDCVVAGDDPRISDQFLSVVEGGAETHDVVLVATVHDHPASAYRTRIIVSDVDPDFVAVADATTAEAIKSFEGPYRDVNIALANQVALIGEELGIDSRGAIETANTQPLCDILSPGPGVGGHCIPVYPYFVLGDVESQTDLIRAARVTNDRMPACTIAQRERHLADHGGGIDGARIGLFGLTYRANVEETRNAPALDIIDLLAERKADVVAVDPFVRAEEQFRPATLCSLPDALDEQFDAVILVTDHAQFEAVEWNRRHGGPLLVDCRDVVTEFHSEVYTLGSGTRRPTPE
jgi:UDP-N-acetyl-D-mannosaminuronic acid dehydrogenase